MPFVAPKGAATNTTANSVNRTTFRPPWVKEDGTSPLKPTVKTSPWAKKTTTAAPSTDKDKSATNDDVKKITPKAAPTAATTGKTIENAKKPLESSTLVKKTEPVNKAPIKPAIKKVAEPTIKQPLTTSLPVKKTIAAKKPPTPPSSSSEEEEEDEDDEEDEESEEETEEETEEESEEDEESVEEVKKVPVKTPIQAVKKATTPAVVNKKPPAAAVAEEKTSELEKRFSLEKPKLRPVVVKRDKSLKKIVDDDEAVEGETEEERERRLRFKLEKPKLRHVKREEKPLPSKSTENILKIRPVLKKVNKIDEIIKEPKEEPKPEFKTKTLRKTPSIRRDSSIKNGESVVGLSEYR